MAFRNLYDMQQGIPKSQMSGTPQFATPASSYSFTPAPTSFPGAVQTRPPRSSITSVGVGNERWGTTAKRDNLRRSYIPPKVSSFLWNVLGNIKGMDVEERAGYLENITAGIKDKLDQYSLRLARGRVLTPEQQARYNSLQASFNDIQGYTTNQDVYDEYLTRLNGQTPEQYAAAQQQSAESDLTMGRRLAGLRY